MVAIRAVTLDCAGTLVQVDWQIDRFAVEAAAHAGLELPPEASSIYRRMFGERLPEFIALNRLRDPSAGKEFYRRLNGEWLALFDIGPDKVIPLEESADLLAFGPGSTLFSLFEDALPALKTLRDKGLRIAIVSNWDYTLHRVLEMLGISPFLEFALASLEEGFEKPDPRLFHLALDRLSLRAEEVLHIGDHTLDDLEGARNAGMPSCLLDRGGLAELPGRLSSLTQIPEAIACLS